MPLVRGDVLILTGSVWQVCVIVACSLRLILLSGFLVDIMFACRTKMSKKKKRRRRGDGWGSATLWLGTRSGLSLQPTGVIGLWASLKYFYLRFFFFFFQARPKFLCSRTNTRAVSYNCFVVFFSHCNSRCSSDVFPGETNKKGILSQLSRRPHESQ